MLDSAGRDEQYIQTNGITLRTIVEGDGPLAILLHGYPRCWYLWRHQIDPLKAAGFRVAVPDQRGYGASDCPPGIEDAAGNVRCIRASTVPGVGMLYPLGPDFYVSKQGRVGSSSGSAA